MTKDLQITAPTVVRIVPAGFVQPAAMLDGRPLSFRRLAREQRAELRAAYEFAGENVGRIVRERIADLDALDACEHRALPPDAVIGRIVRE